MRVILIHLFFIISLSFSLAQENTLSIEDISNDTEANAFVNAMDNLFLECIKIPSPEELEEIKVRDNLDTWSEISLAEISDSLDIRNYEIMDFDNNGHLDLLIRGDCTQLLTILLMNQGNNKFDDYYLSQGNEAFIKFGQLDGKNVLEYYYMDCQSNSSFQLKIKKRTLTFKSGRFYEYYDQKNNKEIVGLYYKTTACFGTCPVFEMSIQVDGTSIYKPKMFNYKKKLKKGEIRKSKNERKGILKTTITKKYINEILDIITSIDINDVKKCKTTGSTDEPNCYLTIRYADGSIDKISDYGKDTSFSLQYVYHLIEELRYNQKWKKSPR